MKTFNSQQNNPDNKEDFDDMSELQGTNYEEGVAHEQKRILGLIDKSRTCNGDILSYWVEKLKFDITHSSESPRVEELDAMPDYETANGVKNLQVHAVARTKKGTTADNNKSAYPNSCKGKDKIKKFSKKILSKAVDIDYSGEIR
jgi:hypothetical protein